MSQSLMSLSDYARRKGVTVVSVSKAVKSGRLRQSVTRDERGQPKIADVEVADREWEANTRRRIDRPAAEPAAASRQGPARAAPAPAPSSAVQGAGRRRIQEADTDIPDYNAARARKEAAAAVKEAALAEMAKIELAELRRQVGRVADFRLRLVNAFTTCRTKLAALPSRARSRDPSLTVAQVALLESLIREALAELAESA